MPNILKNSSILITGGTGSFGKKMVETLLKKKYSIKKLVIFSRDELKQFEMSKSFSGKETNKMRSKKTLHNVRSYHTPSSLLGKIAKLMNCKKLVLTHLVPTKFNEKKLKETIKDDFGKNPIVGFDLLKIKI